MRGRAGVLLGLSLLLAAAGAPPPGVIVHYCGGGVTGGGGGLRIDPDGDVRIRRPRALAPAEETLLRTGGDTYARVAAMLEAAGFDRLPPGEPSNMTCSLTWRRAGRSHAVRWRMGQTPAALGPAAEAMRAAAR